MPLRATCKRLLRDRGAVSVTEISDDDSAPCEYWVASSGEAPPGLLFLHTESTLNVEDARLIKAMTEQRAAAYAVIVLPDPPPVNASHAAKQVLSSIDATVTSFPKCRLAVPYVDSSYVPLHRQVSWEEVEAEVPSATIAALPRISKHDPVCMWYGWTEGFIAVEQSFAGVPPMTAYEAVV